MALCVTLRIKESENSVIIGEKIEVIFKSYDRGKLRLVFRDLTDETITVRRKSVAYKDVKGNVNL